MLTNIVLISLQYNNNSDITALVTNCNAGGLGAGYAGNNSGYSLPARPESECYLLGIVKNRDRYEFRCFFFSNILYKYLHEHL